MMHQPEIEQLPWSEQHKVDEPLFRWSPEELIDAIRAYRLVPLETYVDVNEGYRRLVAALLQRAPEDRLPT